MKSILDNITRDIKSSNRTIRDRAVGWSGLLLEKSSVQYDNNTSYSDLLPSDLVSIDLDEEEQSALIDTLSEAISSDIMTEGMIWSMGKAKSSLALLPLLKIIQTQGYKFRDEATWQSLIALDNLLKRSGLRDDLQEQNTLLQRYEINEWLQQIEITSETRIQKKAHRLMAKIQDSYNFKYADQIET